MTVPNQSVQARQYCRTQDSAVPNGRILQTKAEAPSHSKAEFETGDLAGGGVCVQGEDTVTGRIPVVHVLVVDDLEPVRNLMGKMLSVLGYQASTAKDADEALTKLAQQPIDVLITDLRMPGLSGLELAKIAKTRWPHLAIILFSGFLGELLQGGQKAEGVDLLLAKPLNLESLKQALSSVVRLKGEAAALCWPE